MKGILLNKAEIKAKSGKDWVVLNYLLEDGSSFQTFMTPEEVKAFGTDNFEPLSKDEVTELFTEHKSVVLSFTPRGRLHDIS